MTDQLRFSSKAIPTDLVGATTDELIGRNIFDGTFLSPLVVLRAAAIEHNLATMRDFCLANCVQLAPHAKTTMAPSLISRQIAHGAWAITVANAVQARTLFNHGLRRLLIANQLVNEASIEWALEAAVQGLELYCFVDSHNGLARLDRSHAGRVSVLVEIGGRDGRSGVRDIELALSLAEAARAMESVRFAGVAGYEGVFLPARNHAERRRVRDYLRFLGHAFERIADCGPFEPAAGPILTAGGSACFDDVADILGPVADARDAKLVLRSGCYITHDSGFYQEASPLRGHADFAAFRPALEVIAQVVSRPEPTLALLDFGKRDVSFDEGLPVPLWRYEQTRQRPVPDSWRVSRLMDQHAFLTVDAADEVAVGDFVSFGISHPCTTFDKWKHIPEVDDNGTVVAVVSTEF
ncbi:amino acid deaminase [Candidatus Poriferisocius sp.]|uniref:amino acid deaminase n=1 Tax=Candidatus Poriferisocius sp. TaxID=3101276 RepID=UPI003B526477